MLDEKLVEEIVRAVLEQLEAERDCCKICGGENPCRDIASKECRQTTLLAEPADAEAMRRMKKRTTARIGVGRTGPRLNTQTLLTLRADHAKARDAVFLDVPPEFVEGLGLFTVQSRCVEKNQFLTRPDLGRQLCEEGEAAIRSRCTPNPDVQIFLADGLSSTAIEANAETILASLIEGLRQRGFTVGTPFFVRFGRVGIEDQVAEILGAKVVCVLIGERPGLGSAESMSAYIAYNARVGMPEARRTVVSNIHRDGINAAEAGAYLVDLIEKVYREKASGVALRQ